MIPWTSYPFARRNSARYEPSWPVMPVIKARGIPPPYPQSKGTFLKLFMSGPRPEPPKTFHPKNVPLLFVLLRSVRLRLNSNRNGGHNSTMDPISLLKEYIRIDTTNPPGDCRAAAEFLCRVLVENGLVPVTFGATPEKPNVLCHVGGTEEPGLVLIHHMDVVPARAEEWSVPPFSAEVRDGYLYGRGTLDTKGLGVAHLCAAIGAARSGILRRKLFFVANADEEVGGKEGADRLRPGNAYRGPGRRGPAGVVRRRAPGGRSPAAQHIRHNDACGGVQAERDPLEGGGDGGLPHPAGRGSQAGGCTVARNGKRSLRSRGDGLRRESERLAAGAPVRRAGSRDPLGAPGRRRPPLHVHRIHRLALLPIPGDRHLRADAAAAPA